MRAIGTILLLFILTGCREHVRIRVKQGFELQQGESGELKDRLVIYFREVISDNRCPADVNCIQAGDAVFRLRVNGVFYRIGTDTASITHEGYVIELKDVLPSTFVSTDRPEQKDYRISLEVREL